MGILKGIGIAILVLVTLWVSTLFMYFGWRTIAPGAGWGVPEFWAIFWAQIWFGIPAAMASGIGWVFKNN